MAHSSVRLGGAVLGILLGATWAVVFAWALATRSYNVWGAVIVVPVIVALNFLIISRVGRRNERWLGTVLLIAFGAKVAGALVRYLIVYVVYEGASDAERYNLYAASHYDLWRHGSIISVQAVPSGTHFMELITTAIYTVVGPSPLIGFVVFAVLAFWGQYLLFRAFQIALPTGNGRRYAVLVLLLPSMLYWPSSIGKESWLLLFVGVIALGAAKHFAHQARAALLLLVGAAGAALVRPHIAVLLFAGLLVAQLFRPAGAQSTDILGKVGGLLVLGATALVLTTQSATFLGIDDLSWQAVSETVEYRSGLTDQGGSAFTAVPLTSPTGVPAAVITLLYRPFPWEATNFQMLIQSLEGVFLLFLTVRAWPRLRRLPKVMRHNPYVVFAMVYSASFIVAFSGFGNFGIVARQRVLMLPLLFVLLAVPVADRAVPRASSTREFHDVRR